jgi:hypothetical protein
VRNDIPPAFPFFREIKETDDSLRHFYGSLAGETGEKLPFSLLHTVRGGRDAACKSNNVRIRLNMQAMHMFNRSTGNLKDLIHDPLTSQHSVMSGVM